jgi:hypothetical protein
VQACLRLACGPPADPPPLPPTPPSLAGGGSWRLPCQLDSTGVPHQRHGLLLACIFAIQQTHCTTARPTALQASARWQTTPWSGASTSSLSARLASELAPCAEPAKLRCLPQAQGRLVLHALVALVATCRWRMHVGCGWPTRCGRGLPPAGLAQTWGCGVSGWPSASPATAHGR